MISITRKYHFHAAHRNEQLIGSKCENIHGHTYRVDFTFNYHLTDITSNGTVIPFEEIDKIIEPLIKEQYCHSILLNDEDKLAKLLVDNFPNMKMVLFEAKPTSVENLAQMLYEDIRETPIGSNLVSVTIRETDSSVVTYEPKRFQNTLKSDD